MYVGTAAQKALIDAAYAEAVKHSPDAQRLDGDALRALVPVLNDSIVDGFVDDGARDIDVHALHQGFCAACAKPVVSCGATPKSVHWRWTEPAAPGR